MWVIKQIRKYKVIVSVILGLSGIIMIMSSSDKSAAFGVGVSLLASAITSIVTFMFLDDEEDLKAVRQWGLENVYSTRGEMNHSCGDYLKNARYIKIMAFGLRSWRDSKEEDVKRILTAGGSIRIITMDPDCQNLKAREDDERQDIASSIRELISWAESLDGDIQVKKHSHCPHDFMFLMNNRLFTGPYEYGKDSQQTISFEYSASGEAYAYYDALFERLWKDPGYCC